MRFRIKESEGKSYLVARFTNRWRDYDLHAAPEQGGEIIANGAHKEYVNWLDKNPQHAPELWTWHVWGTERKNRADWWDYSGNFFYMQWPLEADEAKSLKNAMSTGFSEDVYWRKAEAGEPWGLSFGFYVLKYDGKNAAIEKYRAFEVSVLPLSAAANPWTSFELTGDDSQDEAKETLKMFNKKKLAALRILHGDEFVKDMLSSDEADAKALDDAGVETKEKTPAEPSVATEVFASEKAVVEALERLKSIFDADNAALKERLELLEKANAELLAKLVARDEEEAAAAKAAAAPASLLASWMPAKSIATGKSNTAQIKKNSALAKSEPKQEKTPAQKAVAGSGLSSMFKTMEQLEEVRASIKGAATDVEDEFDEDDFSDLELTDEELLELEDEE